MQVKVAEIRKKFVSHLKRELGEVYHFDLFRTSLFPISSLAKHGAKRVDMGE